MSLRPSSRFALVATMLLVAGSSSPALAAPTPTPAVTWPVPGAGASPMPALSVGGEAQSVRPLRNPLVLLDQDVERTTSRSFTLGADVLFATGQDTLSAASGGALTALTAKITAQSLTGKAAVVGNTDDVGSPGANLSLSKRRAAAVTARLTELLAGRNISLTAVGRGETDPLAPNSSDAGRARNRRVSVIFSGTSRAVADLYSIAVPSLQPAPAASATGAPAGSLAATESTLTVGGSTPKKWRVRLDVTGVTPAGPNMIAVQTETQILSTPPGSTTFTSYRDIFSGSAISSDSRSVIYDQAAGQALPVAIDGSGDRLESGHTQFIEPGVTASDWQLYPRPKSMGTGRIELYLPAFGVLTVPVKA